MDVIIWIIVGAVILFVMFRAHTSFKHTTEDNIKSIFIKQLSSPLLIAKIPASFLAHREITPIELNQSPTVFVSGGWQSTKVAQYVLDPKSITIEVHFSITGKVRGTITADYVRRQVYPGHELALEHREYFIEKSKDEKKEFTKTLKELYSDEAQQFQSLADVVVGVNFPFQMSFGGSVKFGTRDLSLVNSGLRPMNLLVTGSAPETGENSVKVPFVIMSS